MSHPASRSTAVTVARCCSLAPCRRTVPPAAAAAHNYVPATMRSGITVYVHPWSLCPPSITTVVLPAPDTRAPQAFRKFCKSVISGSLAALQMEVVPSAPQAASIRFSVAPTEGRLSTISLPRSRRCHQSPLPACAILTDAGRWAAVPVHTHPGVILCGAEDAMFSTNTMPPQV